MEALLESERGADHEASYRLLSSEGRKVHPDRANWARRRSETPQIVGFRIERAEDDGRVVALVRHEPGLDPFIGFSAASERQTWQARRERGGWLVEAEPTVELLLPPDARAPEAALGWARALQACDAERAKSQQAILVPFGLSTAPGRLCGASGDITVGPPEKVPGGPASQQLVAQYGPDTYDWARAVRVQGPGQPFHVVLAPIGDAWKVVGVFEP